MKILFALIPIFCMLLSMAVFKLSSFRTSAIALIFCAVVALLVFSLPISSLLTASLEGTAVAVITIVFVIYSAVLLYNISVASGAVQSIRKLLFQISSDRRIAVLLIAFCFGGFLEGIAGFGTAVILPVGMLILLGFDALHSVLVCLVANTVPVAFGVLGVPAVTLSQVTGLDLALLTKYIAFQLLPFALFLPPLLIVLSEGSVKALKGMLQVSVLGGVSFALAQTAIAVAVGPELAAVGGSVVSAFTVMAASKRHADGRGSNLEEYRIDITSTGNLKVSAGEALLACAPYLLILVLALLPRILFSAQVLRQFPFSFSLQIYTGSGAKPTSFQFLLNSGLVLFLAAVVGGFVQKVEFKLIGKTMLQTLSQLRFNALTVIFLTILSKIMGYSGMVTEIALGLYALMGSAYSLVAPMIGAFGTFLTGSDTSSNVLFGQMQRQMAAKLQLSEAWISSANAAGATAGKMMSPQSIAIAVSSAKMKNRDGEVLRKTSFYCLLYVVLMGILIWLLPFIVQIL